MLKSFRSKALSELWAKGATSKIDARMVKRLFARLDALDAAGRPEDVNIPSFDFHALRGFQPRRYSIHVNGPWCVTFEFDGADAVNVDYEQYH